MVLLLPLVFLAALLAPVNAFHSVMTRSRQPKSRCAMVKFDGDKWIAEKPEETLEAGYPAINTLLRHGPKPFFTRVFQPEDYEQAVLKFMAGDKVDRANAQGNMDKYLNNPQDWGFNRMEEQRRGVKYDYVTVKAKDVILVLVWTTILGLFVGRGIFSLVTGVPYNDFMKNL